MRCSAPSRRDRSFVSRKRPRATEGQAEASGGACSQHNVRPKATGKRLLSVRSALMRAQASRVALRSLAKTSIKATHPPSLGLALGLEDAFRTGSRAFIGCDG